jgi:hypothetical protein
METTHLADYPSHQIDGNKTATQQTTNLLERKETSRFPKFRCTLFITDKRMARTQHRPTASRRVAAARSSGPRATAQRAVR